MSRRRWLFYQLSDLLRTFFRCFVSNLVAALSTYFLARDLDLVSCDAGFARAFFFARLIHTTSIRRGWCYF